MAMEIGSIPQKVMSVDILHNKEEQAQISENTLSKLTNTSYVELPNKSNKNTRKTKSMKISASDLQPNVVTFVSNYGSVSIGNHKSDTWRGANFLSHYMKYNISKIYHVNGVYSHFPDYFDHDVLASGSAAESIEREKKFSDTYTKSFSYSFGVDIHLESALSLLAKLSGITSSASLNLKIGATYSYSCSYTRTQTRNFSWTSYFSVNSTTADYCPQGYTLSVGKAGDYYEIEGKYQEHTIWWWGDFPSQDTTIKDFNAVLASPSDYGYCFVYKLKTNTTQDYVRK
jgi:hypothetical protein